MTLKEEIENLTSEIKIKQGEYCRWIGLNGWADPTAENMRQEIMRLVDLRIVLEETLSEVE